MFYPSTNTEEGLAILSLYPMKNFKYRNLTITNPSGDINSRICVHITVDLSIGSIDFFLTHWSFDIQQQKQNAIESLQFIESFNITNFQIFAGDYNMYEKNSEAIKYFLNNKTIKYPFHDIWKLLRPNETGYTFSTLPEIGLKNRPDRILFRGNVFNAYNVERVGNFTKNNIVPSDHMGLVAQFHCQLPDLTTKKEIILR